MERASLSAVIREDCDSFLNPNKPARDGVLVGVLDFCSRLESARANEIRSGMLLSQGLTAKCELLDCMSEKNAIFEVCYSDPANVAD